MDLNQILILAIVGLLAGVIAGSLGVGGGILIVPALVFFFGFTQHQAQGTSLAVLLPPISILAVINYHRNHYINYKFALILVLTFVVGSYLGSVISVNLPARSLKKIFGILMLIAGARMIFGK